MVWRVCAWVAGVWGWRGEAETPLKTRADGAPRECLPRLLSSSNPAAAALSPRACVMLVLVLWPGRHPAGALPPTARAVCCGVPSGVSAGRAEATHLPPSFLAPTTQESTIGAAFLTKAMPDQGVKFEIW